MSSDSNSSSSSDESTDKNPKPNSSIDQSLDAIEGQLSSISMNHHQGGVKEVPNGSVVVEGNNHEEKTVRLVGESSSEVEEVVEEEREGSSLRGRVLWRNNSELEVEGPGSPSSSGYAGGRGSSSATSVSGIEEIGAENEIREVKRDDSFDGVMDSQAQWVPGKRHVDEVS